MAPSVQRPALIVADRWRDYQLVDCGEGMKQERWGPYTLVRPDPQIIWPRHGVEPGTPWPHWDGLYHRSESGGGQWEFRRPLPDHWEIRYDALGLTFKIRPTSFKHTGLFPEQAVNWDWCSQKIKAAREAGREVGVLNLFGYTGAATCAAAAAGASVCHVDAAEGMVKWCRENAALCGLAEAPIRYIVDDCLKFVRREQKRGRPLRCGDHGPADFRPGQHRGDVEARGRPVGAPDGVPERPQRGAAVFPVNAYTARLSPTVVANLLSELLGRPGRRDRRRRSGPADPPRRQGPALRDLWAVGAGAVNGLCTGPTSRHDPRPCRPSPEAYYARANELLAARLDRQRGRDRAAAPVDRRQHRRGRGRPHLRQRPQRIDLPGNHRPGRRPRLRDRDHRPDGRVHREPARLRRQAGRALRPPVPAAPRRDDHRHLQLRQERLADRRGAVCQGRRGSP